jgi:hypothetical protein
MECSLDNAPLCKIETKVSKRSSSSKTKLEKKFKITSKDQSSTKIQSIQKPLPKAKEVIKKRTKPTAKKINDSKNKPNNQNDPKSKTKIIIKDNSLVKKRKVINDSSILKKSKNAKQPDTLTIKKVKFIPKNDEPLKLVNEKTTPTPKKKVKWKNDSSIVSYIVIENNNQRINEIIQKAQIYELSKKYSLPSIPPPLSEVIVRKIKHTIPPSITITQPKKSQASASLINYSEYLQASKIFNERLMGLTEGPNLIKSKETIIPRLPIKPAPIKVDLSNQWYTNNDFEVKQRNKLIDYNIIIQCETAKFKKEKSLN